MIQASLRAPLVLALLALPLLLHAAPRTEKDVEYGRVGDERLLLDVAIPDGTGPHPAVILVHGGSWMRGDKNGGNTPDKPGTGHMVPLHEPLSRAGFAWFSINYRLVPKHPYPACVDDVDTAIRWVKAHASDYNVDPKRIVLCGASAGGQMVALAAVNADDSTRVAAVVAFYAPTDLWALFPRGDGLGELSAVFTNPGASGVKTVAELLRKASPLYGVKPGLPPFLLIHGDQDKLVPSSQSLAFQKALDAAGVPARLMMITGAGHSLSGMARTDPAYLDQVVAWLHANLGMAPARDTTSAAPR